MLKNFYMKEGTKSREFSCHLWDFCNEIYKENTSQSNSLYIPLPNKSNIFLT